MHPSYIPEYPGSKLLIAFSGRLGRGAESGAPKDLSWSRQAVSSGWHSKPTRDGRADLTKYCTLSGALDALSEVDRAEQLLTTDLVFFGAAGEH